MKIGKILIKKRINKNEILFYFFIFFKMFQNRLSSFTCGVQDFLREREVSNIGTHIKDDDVNSTCTYDGKTVLMMVCMYSHTYNPLQYSYYIPHAVEKIKWLLTEGGADPNKQNRDGSTALMMAACYSKHVKIFKGKYFMEKFEKYKIRPVEQKINRNLSLMIVNYLDKDSCIGCKSSEKIVKILLDSGADPNKQSKAGQTALMLAAHNSSPERGTSSEKTVKILLKAGADPNKQDTECGSTALMMAAGDSSSERGTSSEKTVKILLKAGADPNKQDTVCGWTALMYAARYSSPERGTSSEKTVEILLEAGADPNKQNRYGVTALMMAARDSSSERGTSSEKTVKILLKAGADPNKQETVGGWTALMHAARNSSPERGESSEKTVEMLLKCGADPNKRATLSLTGYTALDLARTQKIKLLIQKYL